jgi:2-polyprenyl-3-methyl-5-hydroxy-6-metoxy-1,4-benzoquinol methylase
MHADSTDTDPAHRDSWPREGLESVPRCPLCDSAGRRLLHARLVDDTFGTAPGRWDLQGCAQCGAAYLDPRPDVATIGIAYRTYYTHGAAPEAVDGRLKAVVRAQVLRFSDAYVRSELRREPVRGADLARAWCVRVLPFAREVIDARYRHLRRNDGGRRLLDVGCGDGTFLRRARELGWEGEGVDFDPGAVAAARAHGFDVRLGSIDVYAGRSNAFDVITCNHVIEHLHDPHALLGALHRLLTPSGELWLETPNIGSVGHAVFGRAWRGLETPRHLVVFNRAALVDAVRRAGLVVRSETPFNVHHVRYMAAASRLLQRASRATDRPPAGRWTALRMLLEEAVQPHRREFVLVRCVKPSGVSDRLASGAPSARVG